MAPLEALRTVKAKVEVESQKGKKLVAGSIMDEMSIHLKPTPSMNPK